MQLQEELKLKSQEFQKALKKLYPDHLELSLHQYLVTYKHIDIEPINSACRELLDADYSKKISSEVVSDRMTEVALARQTMIAEACRKLLEGPNVCRVILDEYLADMPQAFSDHVNATLKEKKNLSLKRAIGILWNGDESFEITGGYFSRPIKSVDKPLMQIYYDILDKEKLEPKIAFAKAHRIIEDRIIDGESFIDNKPSQEEIISIHMGV